MLCVSEIVLPLAKVSLILSNTSSRPVKCGLGLCPASARLLKDLGGVGGTGSSCGGVGAGSLRFERRYRMIGTNIPTMAAIAPIAVQFQGAAHNSRTHSQKAANILATITRHSILFPPWSKLFSALPTHGSKTNFSLLAKQAKEEKDAPGRFSHYGLLWRQGQEATVAKADFSRYFL